MPRRRELAAGDVVLGKYRIVDKIGEGGMAFVYKAMSHGVAGFQRPFVIKRIRPELASSPDLVRGFVQEASLGASLDHPNIVHVLDLGEHKGMLLMVLEYVAGKDLGALTRRVRVARRVLGPEMTAFVAIDVCKALEAAHGHVDSGGRPAAVIHRDVSPQNILISFDGNVKLADFGLARALGVARQTQQGIIKGKLSYMSPEQSRGEEVDGRSDIFSLATVLWETLSGRRLFLAGDPVETVKRVRAAQVPPLAEVAPHVAPDLAALVHWGLKRNRGDRCQSATEMRHALQAYLRTAKRVDQGALAGVLGAYFPVPDPAAEVAEPTLAFDDESDLHGGEGDDEATRVDTAPPEMGPGAVHTMMMFRDPAVDEAVARARAGAAPCEVGGVGPGDGQKTFVMTPAPTPVPRPSAPTPASDGVDLDEGRTRLGMPAAPTPGADRRGAGPGAVVAGSTPIPKAFKAAPPQEVVRPQEEPDDWLRPEHLHRERPGEAPARDEGRTGAVALSLLIGLPLGLVVGALVFWLLSN